MSRVLCHVFLLVTAALHFPIASAMSADAEEWRFTVSLDGKPIGYHLFQLTELNGVLELRSQARFTVKFLFVDAYRYVHDDRELWTDGCLDRIDARTDDNGDVTRINGGRENEAFRVTTNGNTTPLADSHGKCVLTFAYWNPEILRATRLLNSQTGEYTPITVRRIGTETVTARNKAHSADRYRIDGTATDGSRLVIDLWYSSDMKWLALEAITDGRALRYQLL